MVSYMLFYLLGQGDSGWTGTTLLVSVSPCGNTVIHDQHLYPLREGAFCTLPLSCNLSLIILGHLLQ